MTIFFGDLPDNPVLAVDIGSRTTRALLHVPGAYFGENGDAARYAFSLPSPERILCDRIKRGTDQVRPASADAFSLVEESVWETGFSMHLWRSVLAMAGLPQPEAVLVSALEYDGGIFPPDEAEGRGPRLRLGGGFWGLSRSGGISIGSLMAEPPGEDMLRLRAIQRIIGNPVLDSSAAFLLGLLASPGVTERSYREGVTLLFAGRHVVSAGLVFQDRLLAFFELPTDRVLPPDGSTPSLLLHCLEEFRLGWLPKERAAELGGFVDAPSALPPEAEGFRPLFVAGPCAALLEKHGRIVGTPEDRAMLNCRGLLHGYARMCAEGAGSHR